MNIQENPSITSDNIAEWINIDELLSKDKLFSVVYLLDKDHNYELYNLLNFKWHFISNENHKKINEICYSID